MGETKIELTRRWRHEGRLEEASHYRETIREQLRAQGKTRREAREEAWKAARLTFPPLYDYDDEDENDPSNILEAQDFEGDLRAQILRWQQVCVILPLPQEVELYLLRVVWFFCEMSWEAGRKGADLPYDELCLKRPQNDPENDQTNPQPTEPPPSGQ